ncbi:MAG: DNA-binding response regulator [Sulfobacillus thermosulfidooxidans]|uniref:Stage 0 sporulation protein A homolog n=1 Tax=Sulfobacillus thermotolerans TaxID=338644 RepID=A0ABN5GXZ6_9FIRM|nr:response regulator transcription factor [Sulfobacillus sp. hq2]AUW93275.1 DNA-binding response regulator [Sulfobacillus thermotolerans]MCY0907388.1 response regulator transcription factor [Sulfobacillus thermotolerans]POB11645.1 DNA-binding response regulator [Sulfobacillus sp. hq2]PSR35590.1 MAG: DNA-binding response regulator [Sulfobacillus thermosulfidooxidans]
MDSFRVLVVDDEEVIRDVLKIGLSHRGFEVLTCEDSQTAMEAIGGFQPHAAIIDVMMPGEDGFQLSRRLRQNPDLFILMLTARDAVSDRIQGLEGGADDYVIKPFDFDELVARLRAGLRRVRHDDHAAIQFGDLMMDDAAHKVSLQNTAITLTAKEYELLRYLLLNPGIVLSKVQILQHVWGYDYPGDDNLVEVHISSLRDKLQDRSRQLIQTVRGFGYRLGS